MSTNTVSYEMLVRLSKLESKINKFNSCHNPAGPGGGEFCGGKPKGKASASAPKPRSSNDSIADKHFVIPKNFSPEKHTKTHAAITFGSDAKLELKLVPLSRLSSALHKDSGPSKDMEKVLRKGKKLPPLTATYQNGRYQLEDGNSRVSALKRMGYKNQLVPVVVASWK